MKARFDEERFRRDYEGLQVRILPAEAFRARCLGLLREAAARSAAGTERPLPERSGRRLTFHLADKARRGPRGSARSWLFPLASAAACLLLLFGAYRLWLSPGLLVPHFQEAAMAPAEDLRADADAEVEDYEAAGAPTEAAAAGEKAAGAELLPRAEEVRDTARAETAAPEAVYDLAELSAGLARIAFLCPAPAPSREAESGAAAAPQRLPMQLYRLAEGDALLLWEAESDLRDTGDEDAAGARVEWLDEEGGWRVEIRDPALLGQLSEGRFRLELSLGARTYAFDFTVTE